MTRIYRGLICEHDDSNGHTGVYLHNLRRPLAEELGWISYKKVSVQYWVTDVECSKEAAQEDFIRTLTGKGESKYHARYSDLTGYLWTDENLNVGGHDLLGELRGWAGKWLILEVDDRPKEGA